MLRFQEQINNLMLHMHTKCVPFPPAKAELLGGKCVNLENPNFSVGYYY